MKVDRSLYVLRVQKHGTGAMFGARGMDGSVQYPIPIHWIMSCTSMPSIVFSLHATAFLSILFFLTKPSFYNTQHDTLNTIQLSKSYRSKTLIDVT